MFKLPPLSAARVFEVAARHQSFKNAAEELNITASAVSHAVQNLEDWLGLELFRRGGGKLELTDPGAAYATALGQALNAIAEATARLPGRRAQGRLTINSAPGFAARWLLPRLPRFAARHPNISIEIQTSLDLVDLPKEGIDAAVRLAPVARALEHWTHLLDEELVPVCSPALRAQHAGLSAVELIFAAGLIHMTSTTADWFEWFRLVGVEPPPHARAGLRVDTINMALEAARRGFGVALGRAPLIDLEIESGQLVRLDKGVPSGLSYWLVTMEADFQSQDVQLFRAWMLDELGGAKRLGKRGAVPKGATAGEARKNVRRPKGAAGAARKAHKPAAE